MRYVIALGGNAILDPGAPLSPSAQRTNISAAVSAIAPILAEHDVIITHGNGPQVGYLADRQSGSGKRTRTPLDELDAQTEGWIGYLIEQEIMNSSPGRAACTTVLTQVEVSIEDPAFSTPTKPIGPFFERDIGRQLADEMGWQTIAVGDQLRRVVASPQPQSILELKAIELLVANGITVVCAGGGGIPVVRSQTGTLAGVEAVIDKDATSALLASFLAADALLLLTNVEAVYSDWGQPIQRPIRTVSPDNAAQHAFEAGTMGPKVEAACAFVRAGGKLAAIGSISDAQRVALGEAGTQIVTGPSQTTWWA